MRLKEKIDRRQARIGVIALACLGLPLAIAFAKAGFDVTGFDVKGVNAPNPFRQ